jgi:hypothetical protein
MNINESQLFENLITKINNIKERLDKIKNYSNTFDNNKKIEYIEKLSEFNNNLNNLEAISLDMFNEYILQTDTFLLSEEDKNEQKNLQINKKIQNIFLPYMLYLQVLLSNNSE